MIEQSSSPVVDGDPLLNEPGFWPAYLADLVPLTGGLAIVVHFNSGEELTTTDYFLTHPGWSQALDLGLVDLTLS